MRLVKQAVAIGILAGLATVLAVLPAFGQDEAKNLGPVVNSADFDFGPIITADGNALYFTSDRPGGFGGQDIWVSRKEPNGEWGKPANLGPTINTKWNEGPDNLSVDEHTLYFTRCDREGDPGTCDVYYATWDETKKEFVKPTNLGPNINSKYNDANVSVSYDGKTMFFVSDRPTADPTSKRRRWDIYVSHLEGSSWSKAEPIGAPVNTPEDEFHVLIHQNGKLLFFSSNGLGGFGQSDIFVSKIGCGAEAEAIENGTKSPALPGCVIGQPQNLGPPINTPDNDMYFTVSAALDLAYLASDRPGGSGHEDIYVVPFDINLPSGVIIVKGIVANRRTCAPPTPDPKTQVGVYDINTCTPINGAVVRLAEVATDQLIKQGVTGPTGSYKVVIPAGSDYAISATAKGFTFHSERFNVSKSQPYQVIEKNILLDPIGGAFVINNLYFDFDKSTLRPESKNELNNAIRWLNDNPEVRIEVGGHTDSKGSDEYNIRLSNSRAQSVVNYLIQQGHISPARLMAHGYGERLPIATNSTDEGRQLNRRVEFKVIQ